MLRIFQLLRSPIVLALACAASAAAQQPALEYISFVKGMRVYPQSRSIAFLGATAAFLKPGSHQDAGGNIEAGSQVLLVLRAEGSDDAIERWPMIVEKRSGVFSSIRPGSLRATHVFDKEGRFNLTFQVEQERYTTLHFGVRLYESGDPFNPVTRMYIESPFEDLACLQLEDPTSANGLIEFFQWTRGGRFNPSGAIEKSHIEVRFEGRTIYNSSNRTHGIDESASSWSGSASRLTFPKADGGHNIREPDLLKRDGVYDVLCLRNGAVDRAWRFEIRGGKSVTIARQGFKYEPRADFLLPRVPGTDRTSAYDLIWLEALDASQAQAAGNAAPAAVAAPAATDTARWTTDRPFPARPMQVVTTGASPRVDAAIVAGDGVIAYGTGANTGVSYLRIGEDIEHGIPGGVEFSSKVMAACGKKLVLVRKRQIVVFDTETEQLHEIPLEEICLERSRGDRYKACPLAADGMLVVTINDPKTVLDRRIVKVLDLSGTTAESDRPLESRARSKPHEWRRRRGRQRHVGDHHRPRVSDSGGSRPPPMPISPHSIYQPTTVSTATANR